MDQIKFSLIKIIKVRYEIKWAVVVLVLVAVNSSAAGEDANEPPPAASPPQRTEPKINPTISIALACLLCAFLLICLFFFFFYHFVERQIALASTIGNGGERSSTKVASACGLDPAVIATFKSFTYSTVKEIKIGRHALECAVCLTEFQDHESLRLLPECNHVFHCGCIDEWLRLHVTCPVCRASLVPKPNQLSSKTESCCDPNELTKGHVSVEMFDLKHNVLPARKFSRSYSVGHLIGEQRIKNVERYTLRLPEEVQNVVKNSITNLSMSLDVSILMESSLKKNLRSASANFIRGSIYFDYERFGQERV